MFNVLEPSEYVRTLIHNILTSPCGWGSAQSVMLQIVLLVELHHVVTKDPKAPYTWPRFIRFASRWATSKGLDDKYSNAVDVHLRVSNAELMALLSDFTKEEIQ